MSEALSNSTAIGRPARKFEYRWQSIILLGILTVATLVFCPIYLWRYDLTRGETGFFAFYALACLFSITLGYHRLFSHVAFKAAWPIRLLVLIFGGATFQQSAMRWSALHRFHHRYTDTDRDPYNIKRGFFYAHVGWIFIEKMPVDYANVHDLKRDPLVLHQHQHYKLWSYLWGLVVPFVIGTWIGGWGYAILFPVAARIFIVMNSAFFINSVAHSFGDQSFDSHTSARDHWLAVVLTNGEGYHNFHHRFPHDYRNGVRWYHWDPTKWLIWIFSLFGLTSELKRTSAESILLAQETARAVD